ncbi:MAG: tetratricopeptide repeat protein [Candidatus Aminicenantales bacterium]
MNNRAFRCLGVIAVVALLIGASSAFGQYREYYFYGKVVDTSKNPVAGVEILLRDVETSRGYNVKTDKKGEFKFAGLPHGVYSVTFKKEGFASKTDEWRFAQLQDTMQKVEIPTLTLVSRELVEKEEKFKINETEIQAAGDLIRNKDYDGAIARLMAFLEKNPEEPNAMYFLGLSYSRKHLYAEAVAKLLRVAELVPKFPPVFFELGGSYKQLGEADKAVAAYVKNFELDPANAASAYNAGLILFGLGRVAEAQIQFEKALAIKPDDPDILEMTGRCYINAGELAKAIEILEKAKAASTDKEKIKFLDDLIQALKEKKQSGS